ncbi:MAG TPA: 3-phosphoshikimate 1-carboxyvinyltransferase [Candidatus Omnitrophica bacterium]|nr:MAG: 3-phosphoshikimate 1-carboxyvinyltransferase [Omnitrophica WOR_2 bacterium GWA2_53_43]HBO96873.1 3-phosphoshikimate 1-carboxyvinyltransferase [Candidatus Omnitrophota bacterium]HCI44672.1 3-phosphoshikimate 1-carboxyvinyltransferase [Candidatus Omnitrophota bacterium]
MILQVQPAPVLRGSVRLPASKSHSIRAFLIASCGGASRIQYPSDCDDAKVAMRAARKLGARVTRLKSGAWQVTASAHPPCLSNINVQESGTVLRLLLPLLALRGSKIVIDGKGTLRGRPNLFLTRALRAMGVRIRGAGEKESVPIRLSGGTLRGGDVRVNGSLSSQFISALLIACPQLDHPTRLTVDGGKIVSTDYIAMTRQVLAQSGVRIRSKGARRYSIAGNQRFKGLKNFLVPSDYGLAAFLMAAALLNHSDVVLKGILRDNLVQADRHILPLLRKMGARFQKTSQAIHIKGPSRLKGGNFSLKDCPDLVPIMAVIALFARGKTRLRDIGHARAKESDRIGDLTEELRKVGARIEEKKDAMVVHPQPKYRAGCLLDSHRDHRLAMAFAVLGTKLGARIRDIECTAKSYPAFVRDFRCLGVKVHKIQN